MFPELLGSGLLYFKVQYCRIYQFCAPNKVHEGSNSNDGCHVGKSSVVLRAKTNSFRFDYARTKLNFTSSEHSFNLRLNPKKRQICSVQHYFSRNFVFVFPKPSRSYNQEKDRCANKDLTADYKYRIEFV